MSSSEAASPPHPSPSHSPDRHHSARTLPAHTLARARSHDALGRGQAKAQNAPLAAYTLYRKVATVIRVTHGLQETHAHRQNRTQHMYRRLWDVCPVLYASGIVFCRVPTQAFLGVTDGGGGGGGEVEVNYKFH
jgi:hypothetical protein